VVDLCRRCFGPIFRDSPNRVSTGNVRVDGIDRLRHRRCPERVAAS